MSSEKNKMFVLVYERLPDGQRGEKSLLNVNRVDRVTLSGTLRDDRIVHVGEKTYFSAPGAFDDFA